MTRAVRIVGEWTFLLAVALLPVMTPAVDVDGTTVVVADALLVLSGACVAALLVAGRLRPLRDAFVGSAIAYVAAVAIATTTSLDRNRSTGRLLIDAYVVGLGVLAFAVLRTRTTTMPRVACAWLAGAAVTALGCGAGLVLDALGRDTRASNTFLAGKGSAPSLVLPRLDSLFSNPNAMCSFVVPAAVFALLAMREGWLRREASIVLLLASAGAIALSYSPGIGGAFVAAGIVLSPRWRAASVAGAVAFVVAAVTLSSRPTIWRAAARHLSHRPVTGSGPGVAAVHVGGLTDAHDTWLNVGVQSGVLGICALGVVVGWVCVRAWRRRPDPIVAAVLAAVAGTWLYHGLTLSIEETRHAWVLLGLLAAAVDDPAARTVSTWPTRAGALAPSSPRSPVTTGGASPSGSSSASPPR